MKISHIHLIGIPVVACCIVLGSCDRFLEEKSDKKLVLPNNAANLQALLDNGAYVNNGFCSAREIASADFYLSDANFNNQRDDYKKQYTWDPGQQFADAAVTSGTDWQNTYEAVYLCTSIVDALSGQAGSVENRVVLGQALAIRAYRYLDAALTWAPAYDPETASTDLGVPLRNDPDFNLPTVRAVVQQTYDQVIADALAAIPLLPVVNINAYRASRPFGYAILARAYLAMANYEKAGSYADSCLQLHPELINYNTLNTAVSAPFTAKNPENIFFAAIARTVTLNNSVARIDPNLVVSYHQDDLRKQLFFTTMADGSYQFKGSYTGAVNQFAGVSTAELYLIRAECAARLGNAAMARADLNMLLASRYVTNAALPYADVAADEILTAILDERRKELLLRGLRWMDIKRLNKEGAGISLSRTVNGIDYELPANDLRYALPIPDDIIRLSGIPQNPR